MSRLEMFMIVNPVSDNSRTGQRWAGIQDRLRMEGAQFDVEFAHEPGHATTLGRDAAASYRTIVAVGDT